MEQKIQFTKEEFAHLSQNSERCKACGHMNVFHNFHCCEFCKIEDCPCEWGKVEEDSRTFQEKINDQLFPPKDKQA